MNENEGTKTEELENGSGPEQGNGPTLEEINKKVDDILSKEDKVDYEGIIKKQHAVMEKLIKEIDELKDANLALASQSSAQTPESVEQILAKSFIKE